MLQQLGISLIGMELKIYSKILANRIQPLLSKLVHLDKVELAVCLEARDNLNKTILPMQHEQVSYVPMCLLSVDTEKAFDRVSWPSLIHTILQIRLDPKMISNILALYSGLSTGVRVNGSLSSRFFINNGTCQECPCLYILMMEHLAVEFRNNAVGSLHTTFSLFADVLLLYVSKSCHWLNMNIHRHIPY